MAKIVVDGISYEVNSDNNLLQECLSQGLDLPYFCWHPSMGSVGACRQCAVKQYRDENDENGILVMACMTPAADGSIISIKDEQAADFRSNVIESLMISHPHDCPVCEEGGECHLQDMTLMSGHNYRRYDRKKVTHHNQYLGPFIGHEMNRCITCYRCVRYYDDYAGGTDLSAQASHHHVYFGRHEEGVLESEFSGNLVEVCPTGVFTDKTFSAHYSRKWDLQVAPSVCVSCSIGCNTSPGERYGELRRVVNRYNSEINGYFLCDRGRFGYDFINSDERLGTASSNSEDLSNAENDEKVIASIAELTEKNAVGIGSPRASNEANFALKQAVGAENFYAGCSDAEFEIMQLVQALASDSEVHFPSIREIEQADAIVIVAEDITNTAPRAALAVRQAVRNKAQELAKAAGIPQWQDAAVRELAQRELSPLTILSGYATRLDDVATRCIVDSLDGICATAAAISRALDGEAPEALNSSSLADETIAEIVSELSAAKRPLVISGASSAHGDVAVAAANLARAIKRHRKQDTAVDLCLFAPEVNTLGMAMMVPAENSLGAALDRIQKSGDAVLILENDLFRRAATESVKSALAASTASLVLDQIVTPTTAACTASIPVTGFSEQESSYVNYEGRAQLSYQVHRNHGQARPAWKWLSENNRIAFNDVLTRCAETESGFARLSALLQTTDPALNGMKVPRQSHRYSGRTAMKANLNVHEPKQAQDFESPLSFSMEGLPATKDANILVSSWSPQWNSNQSISKFQEEINGELKQGHVGENLFSEPTKDCGYRNYTMAVADEQADGATHVVVPALQIFGSEELSARSTPISQRATACYAGLSPEDAQKLGARQGTALEIVSGEQRFPVEAAIRVKMKSGTVAIFGGDNQINLHDVNPRVSIELADAESVERAAANLIVSDYYYEEL